MKLNYSTQIIKFLYLLTLLQTLTACTAIRPSNELLVLEQGSSLSEFSYQEYAELLAEHVNDQGRVDYQRLQKDSEGLERFYSQIATYSPDSHPELFPTAEDKLAYWINAYNSTAIKGVLQNYPLKSVADVKEPALLFFFPSKSGFFFFQRFIYGGVETSLYFLENSVIRKRFADPRYHFALNCASSSCPELPQKPFYPEKLEEQLHRETRKFINDERSVRFDETENTLYLSAIFDWYEKDFINYLRREKVENPTLHGYVQIYADGNLLRFLQTSKKPKIVFLSYDWALNDQR